MLEGCIMCRAKTLPLLLIQVFTENETKKTISVPIINDDQYEADVDFYVLLKKPEGEAEIGDPSVCRVTIIDDDG